MSKPRIPPDLMPTRQHYVLLLFEEGQFVKALAWSVRELDLRRHEHLVLVVDLRGGLGRVVGEAVLGEGEVHRRLSWSSRHGLPPSFSVVRPLAELHELLKMCGDDVLGVVESRPPASVPILVVDLHNNPALLLWQQGRDWRPP